MLLSDRPMPSALVWPLRGGRLRRVRACHSGTSQGKRNHRSGWEHSSHIRWRSRGTAAQR